VVPDAPDFADPGHVPVLPAETLELLAPRAGEVVVDATLGRGGHAAQILPMIAPGGTLVATDLDRGNLDFAAARLEAVARGLEGVRVIPVHASFVELPRILAERELAADALVADLGFASTQVDDPGRGLSFGADGPLDMRLDRDRRGAPTAADVVNRSSEIELARVLAEYGEEPPPIARRIAAKIVEARAGAPIHTTAELTRLVLDAYGPRARSSRMHPATKTFMALRIAVNDELAALASLLAALGRAAEAAASGASPSAGAWLRPGARLAVISFHSLEDRQVKQAFASLVDRGLAHRLTRKPVTASDDEVRVNPRSRSARLRAVVLAGATVGGAHG